MASLNKEKHALTRSIELIDYQRRLISSLQHQFITPKIAGKLRVRTDKNDEKITYFVEKGVDVSIAIDIIEHSFVTPSVPIILCSSDSYLQPAIRMAQKRGLIIT
jgi:uncharacterized LabA/DUF88 family protein